MLVSHARLCQMAVSQYPCTLTPKWCCFRKERAQKTHSQTPAKKKQNKTKQKEKEIFFFLHYVNIILANKVCKILSLFKIRILYLGVTTFGERFSLHSCGTLGTKHFQQNALCFLLMWTDPLVKILVRPLHCIPHEFRGQNSNFLLSPKTEWFCSQATLAPNDLAASTTKFAPLSHDAEKRETEERFISVFCTGWFVKL